MMHDKTGLLHLAATMHRRGIHHLIISPGSRNAPIVTVFNQLAGMECLSITDERSAAFFALGLAQQLHQPVAIACTSGSAALNYAPAIAEAFYQKIPLIVLTADRPLEWIDQGDGQTIRQQNVFANYIRKSVQLPQAIHHADDLHYNDRLISEALNACLHPAPGPVHINIPFTEPLYGFDHKLRTKPKDFELAQTRISLTEKQLYALAAEWNNYPKKLILVGQMPPDTGMQSWLIHMSQRNDTVVLSETTSNIQHPRFIACIDRSLQAIPPNHADYTPGLLISLGGTVVSKKVKAFLRQAGISAHWHIDPAEWSMDTYQKLSRSIPLEPQRFFEQLMPLMQETESRFAANWQLKAQHTAERHHHFLAGCPYSDLKVFETLLQAIPPGYDVQLGNSTPVRYAQLFEQKAGLHFYSNRGTSGIDGSLSTAVGAAFASQKPTLMITGDQGFFYDSNALWNKYIPANLKIIVINNEGGGIFRFIAGPDRTAYLEDFFEARHQTSAEPIATAFGLDYTATDSLAGLQAALPGFFAPGEKANLLEIKTPAEENAIILRDYFKSLSS